MINRNKKTLLCCLRVRSAGLLIGLVDSFLHLVLLLALCTAITRPSAYDYYLKQLRDDSVVPQKQQQQLVSNAIDQSQSEYFFSINNVHFLNKQDKTAAFMVTIGSALITNMYVYGIFKRKANYLLPYFCLKVFHVVITVLTTLGFYSCLPNVKLWIKMHSYFPYKDELLNLDKQSLELIVFASLLAITLFKIYITIIIWKCYRYIVYRSISHTNHASLLPTTAAAIATIQSVSPSTPATAGDMFTFYKSDERRLFPSQSSLLPPKYDEIVKNGDIAEEAASASDDVTLPPPYIVVTTTTENK